MAEDEQSAGSLDKATLITLTSDIVAAHVSNNSVAMEQLSELIASTYQALATLGAEQAIEAKPEPAVSVRASIKKDHIVCLDCGKKMKMLKRHLATEHNLSIYEYRARWGLASDYPLVAPDYAAVRRGLAKKIGLGRKPGESPKTKTATKTAAAAKTAALSEQATKAKAAESEAPAARGSAKKATAPKKATTKPAAGEAAPKKATNKAAANKAPAAAKTAAATKPAAKKSAAKKAPASKTAKK